MTDGNIAVVTPLPALAQQINLATRAAETSACAAVAHAPEAGRLLAEAKALLQHGQWEPWLIENCAVAPRTAQAYMRLHRKLVELPDEEGGVRPPARA